MPIVRTRPDRTRGPWPLAEASVCVPLGEADRVVVNRRTSGAGTHPKRRSAYRAPSLDGNALDSTGFLVDDEPGHLMVCVPAGPVPCALMVAGVHPHAHGARASDLVHRLRSDGRAVRRRVPHQVTGAGLVPSVLGVFTSGFCPRGFSL